MNKVSRWYTAIGVGLLIAAGIAAGWVQRHRQRRSDKEAA